jgi:hypothetical protein
VRAEKLALLLFFGLIALSLMPAVSALVIGNCSGDLVINETSTLANTLISNGTCITINASNVELDCLGLSIIYGINNTVNNSQGIAVFNQINVTIKNCNITDNASGAGFSNIGINLTRTNHSLIINNTVLVNSTGANKASIWLRDVINTTVINNTVNAFSSASSTEGIHLEGTAVTFANNTVRSNVLTANALAASGIVLLLMTDSVVANNTLSVITTVGPAGRGIDVRSISDNNLVANNTIAMTAGGSANTGISVRSDSDNNNVEGNTVNISGSSNDHAVVVDASLSNRFARNLLVTNATLGRGINIHHANFTRFFNTTLSNPTEWINTTGNTLDTNLTNTTFVSTNGSIAVVGLAKINGSHDVSKAGLNVTFNKAFLNTTNLTFLNTTGRITLNGIAGTDPDAMVDLEDDGTFVECGTGICTEISFGSSTFVYDVTQFTSYSSSEGNISDCSPGGTTINSSVVLTSNVTGESVDCIIMGASNIELDCKGFHILYATVEAGAAVRASVKTNVTVKNCNISTVSGSSTAIQFHATNNSQILNTNISTGGAASLSDGVFLSGGANNIVNNLSIFIRAADAYGIRINNSENSSFIDAFLTDVHGWIFTNRSANFTRTTFNNTAGKIFFSSKIQINSSNITHANLNVSNNRAFLNASNLSFLNTTARITLLGISFLNPEPQIDREDDGSFVTCTACAEVDYTGTTFVFDAPSFSAHQAGETSSGGGSSSGGGGGGAAGAVRSMTTNNATFTLRRTEKVTFDIKGTQYTLTVLNIFTDRVLYRVSTPTQEFTIMTSKAQLIDVNQDGSTDIRVLLVSMAYGQAVMRIEKTGVTCIESWACEAWGQCVAGTQARTCTDLNSCGTMASKPKTTQTCAAPLPEALPTPPIEPAPVPEPAVEAPPRELPAMEEPETGNLITNLFYGLAVVALIVFGALWYFALRKHK